MNQLCLSSFGQFSLWWPSGRAAFAILPYGSILMWSTSWQRFLTLPELLGKETRCLCTAQEFQLMKTPSVSLHAKMWVPHPGCPTSRFLREEEIVMGIVWLVHKKGSGISSNDFHIQLNKPKLKWSICFQKAFSFCRTNKILPPLKLLTKVPFASAEPEFPTKLPSDPEFTTSLIPLSDYPRLKICLIRGRKANKMWLLGFF